MGSPNKIEVPLGEADLVVEQSEIIEPDISLRDRLALDGMKFASAQHNQVKSKLSPIEEQQRHKTLDDVHNAIF